MFNQANLSTVIQVVTLLGVAWAIYNSLRRPQEKSETNDAVFDERMKNYENTTSEALKLALNHSHSVENKLDLHISQSQQKGLEDAKWQGKMEALLGNLIKK